MTTEPHTEEHEYTLPTSRIEGLSDAVFAIVMTLLVLELKVPEVQEGAGRIQFVKNFVALWPEFLNYFISFIILGVYWIGHHKQFHYIQHSDRMLLWLNMFFLMFVALIPFSTALLGTYPERHVPILFYSMNLMVVAIFLYAKWIYATNNHRLVRQNLPFRVIRRGKRKIITGIFIYLLTIAVSAYNVQISLLLFFLVPILYILPGEWPWQRK